MTRWHLQTVVFFIFDGFFRTFNANSLICSFISLSFLPSAFSSWDEMNELLGYSALSLLLIFHNNCFNIHTNNILYNHKTVYKQILFTPTFWGIYFSTTISHLITQPTNNLIVSYHHRHILYSFLPFVTVRFFSLPTFHRFALTASSISLFTILFCPLWIICYIPTYQTCFFPAGY